MSSTFVPSVERVHLPQNRGGRPARDANPHVSAVAVPSPVYHLGRRSSVALLKDRSRWGWEWLAEDSGSPLIIPRPPVLLFPATRETPPFTSFPLDVVLQAATRYIHDTPDIYEPDIVAQLVAEELTLQHKAETPIVHSGRTVVVIEHPLSRLARTLLAFPMGAVGQDLNISAFLPTSNARHHGRLQSRFVPSATAVDSFPTTILQLASSSVSSDYRNVDSRATVLLARLEASTHLLNVFPNPDFVPPTMAHPVTSARVGELSVSATEGRRHVDMDLCPLVWSRAAVVDEGGAVWLWWEEKEKVNGFFMKRMKLKKVRDVVDEAHDGFFRVAFGTRQDTLLVLSRNSVTTIDLAASPVPKVATILKTNDPTNVFTSLDKTAARRGAQFTCLCSSKELTWITDNTMGTPALRWSHHRGDKQPGELDILVIPTDHFGDGNSLERFDTVVVSSPDLGTLQAVQVTTDQPARLVAMPFFPGGIALPLYSPVLLPFHNVSEHRGSAHVVGATNLGALQIVKLEMTDSSEIVPTKLTTIPQVKWSEPVKALATRDAGALLPEDERDWESKSEARYEVIPARWAWSHINEWDLSETKLHTVAFQRDLRESDTRLEHVVTAAERARDFHFGEPPEPSEDSCLVPRPNLLRRLDFIDAPEQRACLAGLSMKYPMYFSFVGSTGSLLADKPVETPRVAVLSGQRRATAENSRLNCDLALSSATLWSEALIPCSPSPPTDDPAPSEPTADDLFAAAAGQLSLEERPTPGPPMRLLPLRTRERDSMAFPPPLDFVAADHLLGEWTVGDNVRQYKWSKFDLSAPETHSLDAVNRAIRPLPSSRIPRPLPSLRTVPQSLPSLVSASAVPAVLAASTTSSLPRQAPRPHPARSSPPPTGGTSQEANFPHTQVERGPFGARPEATRFARRKAPKKRQGGF